jgi:signal transduction histidine kinase
MGMRDRAAVHGGELIAGPASDGGFRVKVRIPLGTIES